MFQGLRKVNEYGEFDGQMKKSLKKYEDMRLKKNDF